MADLPCARGGRIFTPRDIKAHTSSERDALMRTVPANVWVLGAVAAFLLTLSGCTFADGNANGKAQPPAATAAVQPTGPTPMDTFRALAPPEGIKFIPLFATPIKDEGQRFARLEQSVQFLRNDFDTVTPTLVRLAAIEKDIRELVSQLRTLNDGTPIAEVAPAAPVALAAQTAAPKTIVAAAVPPVAPPAVLAPTKNSLPGRDVTGGTETASAVKADAGKPVSSLPVTPEAAPTGKLPPDGAASPSFVAKPAVPAAAAPAPAVVKGQTQALPKAQEKPPAPAPVLVLAKTPEKPAAAAPLDLTPVLPDNDEAGALQEEAQSEGQVMQTPPAAAAAAPKVTMGPVLGDVRAIRIGDHIDKTRVVLDVTAKAPFTARLENDGRRLVIELPQYAWKAETAWRAVSAALVSGYRYADGVLVVDLLAPAVIRQQVSLPAEDGAGPRVMIDLFSSMVHVE